MDEFGTQAMGKYTISDVQKRNKQITIILIAKLRLLMMQLKQMILIDSIDLI